MVWEYSDDFLVECSTVKWLTLALSPAILCKSLNGRLRQRLHERHWRKRRETHLFLVENTSFLIALPSKKVGSELIVGKKDPAWN